MLITENKLFAVVYVTFFKNNISFPDLALHPKFLKLNKRRCNLSKQYCCLLKSPGIIYISLKS